MGKDSRSPIQPGRRRRRPESQELSRGECALVREQLRDYLDRTGLATRDFAGRINYSSAALNAFLADAYSRISGSSAPICQAISNFIVAHPIQPSTQVFGELYETANVRAMRKIFQGLLRRPTAGMVYGPPGNQKSFALQQLVAELNRMELNLGPVGRRAFYTYADVKLKPMQLIKEVAIACGVSSVGDRQRLRRNMAFEFQGRRVLVIVDEAQHLDLSCLEALRVLLDQPPNFSLLLAGSHNLRSLFDRFAPTLEQWNSRLVEKVLLPGVGRDEAEGIIHREVGEWLKTMTTERARRTVNLLIDGATVSDAFENGKSYINIRTLVNTLDQVNLQARQAS